MYDSKIMFDLGVAVLIVGEAKFLEGAMCLNYYVLQTKEEYEKQLKTIQAITNFSYCNIANSAFFNKCSFQD